MWWLSCFKPSKDAFDRETDIAIEVSKHEADVQDAEQIELAIQESSRLHQQEEEKRRRAKELEKDAQIAHAIEYEERERRLKNGSALKYVEDEQLARTVYESLKENDKRKQSEKQVKKDEQLALIVKGNLNKMESPPRIEKQKSISCRAPLDVDGQFAKAVEESLKNKGKQKQFEDEQVKKDGQFVAIVQESIDSPPRLEGNKNISTSALSDEQLQQVIWESLKGKGIKQFEDEVEDDGKLSMVNPSHSMCGGCSSAVEHGRSVNVLGVPWHPQCFCCDACDKSIAIHEVEKHVSNSRGKFHKSCYQRYCYVCKERKMGAYAYNQHPFWKERYCQTHETDGTPKCCSCERLEPRGTNYVMLGDGRWLCLECMESSLMDSDECQPLHFEIREFFEGLNMKIEKPFHFLLVEKQALNEAVKEEKIDNQYEVVTRGICLSEAQTITSVSKRPRMGPNRRLIGMGTESHWYGRKFEVTAILILYGLPRLLTGYILAHEMMHAYLRLNGHRKLNNVLEEGICQVLGHMWLESQRFASTDAAVASSSHTPPPDATTSKKGDQTDFEKRLVEFCKYQIETDDSPVYGVGFKKVNKMMVSNHQNIKDTLKQIQSLS